VVGHPERHVDGLVGADGLAGVVRRARPRAPRRRLAPGASSGSTPGPEFEGPLARAGCHLRKLATASDMPVSMTAIHGLRPSCPPDGSLVHVRYGAVRSCVTTSAESSRDAGCAGRARDRLELFAARLRPAARARADVLDQSRARRRHDAAEAAASGASCATGACGTVNQNRLPSPGALSTPMRPPWASTISRAR